MHKSRMVASGQMLRHLFLAVPEKCSLYTDDRLWERLHSNGPSENDCV